MYPGAHSAVAPEHPAVIMANDGRVMTYRALEEESSRLARFLHDQGLRRGDGIVIVSPNDPLCFVVYWAAMRSGLYVTPLNIHMAERETVAVLRNCQPQAAVVSASCGDLAEAVFPQVEGVAVRLSFGGPVEGFSDYTSTLAGTGTTPLPDQPRGQDMLYSSGTTGGTPKGIRPELPSRQVHEPGDPLVDTFGPKYGFDVDTVYLSPAPLYHGGPLRFCVVVQSLGGTVVILDRFDPERALAAIERYRCTHSQWVPTMFVRMLKLPDGVRRAHDTSSMRCAVHSSAPCPRSVKQAMIDWWGPVLEEYYASQEAAGITMISSAEWLERRGSVGRAILGDIKICGDDGQVLGPHETGMVYFARDRATFQYHKDPAATRHARHPLHECWSTAGDIGHLDEDGYLYLTDRAAFMIISGGVNIYPQEIENELALHPAVDDVAVIGVPDPDLGQRVTAVICPAPTASPGEQLELELRDYLKPRVASYKLPKDMHFARELPRTPTGKLAKASLVRQYSSGDA
nr:acyl-CoA synthetase [Umezawaea tangerina]